MTTEPCASCEIAEGVQATPGGMIFESALVTLTHHGNPHHATRGFVILQPRRHVEHISDLTAAEAVELGGMLRSASQALASVLAPEKVYICSFGSMVRHVHFYLIPKSPEMPLGTRLLDELADGKWACSYEEATAVAMSLRAVITKTQIISEQ